jgi:N-acylneuraminate cytidylyltransferase/CMP-N,N'-diacetyllegionaminic acid synthase
MEKQHNILAYIPVRSGSKRIKGKNIRNFLGKPLVAYTIEQMLRVPYVDRVLVDTNSEEIAAVARRYGADVPFLRPDHLAQDRSNVIDSIFYTLDKLEKDEGYMPTHIFLPQATSPLRTKADIDACWKMIQETDATTVITMTHTHPKLYHLSPEGDTILANGLETMSNNTQTWEPAYIPNGAFYVVEIDALRNERVIITKKTKAVICPKWRSVDLDTPEEWIMAELLYKNRDEVARRTQEIKNDSV